MAAADTQHTTPGTGVSRCHAQTAITWRRAAQHLSIAFLLCTGPARHAAAQTGQTLTDISLEQLLEVRVESVFGAADRLQPVTEVPSSVTIITADDITRYGYATLADILRGVRGFYVTNDRNYSYLGARGLSRPGDYNSRVLLLVNGHRMNDNVYDQASIGADFGIDPAMFERVEIIRGPASSIYGTNALFAIVNVVTRRGASINGASFDVEAGTLNTQLIRGSAGRQLANGVDVAFSGSYERSSGRSQLYFPAFDVPGGNGGIATDLDAEQSAKLYGRFALHNFAVTGFFGRRTKDVPTASFETVFDAHDPKEHTTDDQSSIIAQYARPIGQSRLAVETSLDHFTYAGVYPYPGAVADGPPAVFNDGATGLRWTASGRVTQPLPWQQMLTLGGEFVDNIHQDQFGEYVGAATSADDVDVKRSSSQGAAYVQNDIRVRPWLLLNGGLRYDVYSEFTRATPRGAIILMPSVNHALKYLYGQAFRAPNTYELHYYPGTDPSLRPESIHTHEWVWEAYFGERVRTSASLYRYRVARLVDLHAVDPDAATEALRFENGGTIRVDGLEFESEVRLKGGAQALASYSLQDAGDEMFPHVTLSNSPRHMAKLRFSAPIRLKRSFASFEWQYLSRRNTLAGNTVDPASVLNAGISLQVGRGTVLTGQIRNLFDSHYADPGSEEHRGDVIEQNGRTLRVGLRWAFWNPK